MDRRGLLRALGTATLVVGFDPLARVWVTKAEADEGASFRDAPPLDGQLLLDEASREAAATDKGNMVRRVPLAVLLPGSVGDISAMVRYCREHTIPVAVRGQAHTTFGQGLSPGLLIENRPLGTIHSISRDGADVDAGVLWKELIVAAYEERLTPPAITGYTALSIAGTLSVGGIAGLAQNTRSGAQVDHTRSLEVVTGTGKVLACSDIHNRDLFEAMLGGLGQCGVITRAHVDLVPARERARVYTFHHRDIASLFRDLRVLLANDAFDQVYTQWLPPSPLVSHTQAVVFYDVTNPPDDLRMASGVSTPPQAIVDTTYLEYIFLVDNLVDLLRATVSWDRLVKPWFDVFLPASTVEAYVGDVVPTLTAEDVGPGGFVLLFPLRRSLLRRPFFRMPKPDGDRWVYLFDVLTTSPQPGPDPAFASRMLARNDRLFQTARPLGGVRYPIGSLSWDQADWRQHYGSQWNDFRAAKHRFDPAGILAPGPGIFG